MIKEYCDICKEEITNKTDNEEITIPYFGMPNFRFVDMNAIDKVKIGYRKYTLCRECALKFVNKISRIAREEIKTKIF